MATKDKCIIENCGNDVRYIYLQVCGACYAGLSFWRGRTIADKNRRLAQIDRLQSRMEFMIDHPRHAPERKKR